MASISYALYSTSNSEYQSWQCELLDATFRWVGQPGRLVRLCSEDPAQPTRLFDSSETAEVLCLPSWAENEATGDFWPIANKPASMKLWLESDSCARDADVILFLDPDMVFLEPVELDVSPGEVVGQRWVDERIETHFRWERYGAHVKQRITRDSIVMYPFCATVGDMRCIVDRFIEISQVIRDGSPDCWEADMYGLVIAMLEAGLDVRTRDDLGVCNNWAGHRDRLPKIIHYSSSMLDHAGKRLWHKQDYTAPTRVRPWQRPPLPTSATNAVESRLLEIIHEHVDRQERVAKSQSRFAWERQTGASSDSE